MAQNLLAPNSIVYKSYPLSLTASVADIVPAPGVNSAVECSNLILSNTDTVARTATITLKKNAGTSYELVPTVSIPPQSAIVIPLPVNLEATDSIQGVASLTSVVKAIISGKLYT